MFGLLVGLCCLFNRFKCEAVVAISYITPDGTCAQAAARQAKFDQSAVGKAARKAVENVAKEKGAAGARQDTTRDWLT